MTYGLEIKNNSDRVIIDQSYPNFYIVNETFSAATVGSNYPTTNPSDLIIARTDMNQNGLVTQAGGQVMSGGQIVTSSPRCWGVSSIGQSSSCTPTSPAGGYRYHSIRKVIGNQAIPTSGFGLVVYGPSGNDILFSSVSSNKQATLVSIGNLSGASIPNPRNTFTSWSAVIAGLEADNQSQLITYYPSSTGVLTNLSSYFCCVSSSYRNTQFREFSDDFIGRYKPNRYWDQIQGYEYIWTGPDQGRIRIVNFTARSYDSSDNFNVYTTNYEINTSFDYLIFKVNT
jgi:hypothetical protein